MSRQTSQDQADAARAYEGLMVPALLGPWASKVVSAAKIQPGQRVLDVACGTGILAREAAFRTGPTGLVVGLDASPGMLEVAGELAPAIEWRHGLAESLPFADRSFDAVISQFGLMFFTDRREALREALRVLSPGGSLTVAVWDSLENIPAYAAVVALLERVAGRRAADALRAPFVLGDRNELVALLSDAGVSSVQISTDRAPAQFPGVRVMIEADLRGWLPTVGIVLPEDQIARILEEAEEVLRPYVATDGTVVFESSAHIATGSKP